MLIETFETRVLTFIEKNEEHFEKMFNGKLEPVFSYGTTKVDNEVIHHVIISGKLVSVFINVCSSDWDDCFETALRVLKAYGPKPTRERNKSTVEVTHSEEYGPSAFSF